MRLETKRVFQLSSRHYSETREWTVVKQNIMINIMNFLHCVWCLDSIFF